MVEGEEVEPAVGDGALEDPFEGEGVELDLGGVEGDAVGELLGCESIGFEVEEPEVAFAENGKVDDALDDDEFVVEGGLGGGEVEGGEVGVMESEGEREFALGRRGLGADAEPDFGLPEREDGFEVEGVGFGRGEVAGAEESVLFGAEFGEGGGLLKVEGLKEGMVGEAAFCGGEAVGEAGLGEGALVEVGGGGGVGVVEEGVGVKGGGGGFGGLGGGGEVGVAPAQAEGEGFEVGEVFGGGRRLGLGARGGRRGERILRTRISHHGPLNRSDSSSPYLPLPNLSHRFAGNGWGGGRGEGCPFMGRGGEGEPGVVLVVEGPGEEGAVAVGLGGPGGGAGGEREEGAEPIEPVVGGEEGVGREGGGGALVPAFGCGGRGGADEEEALGGAGEGDVAEAEFLAQGFAALVAGGEEVGEAGVVLGDVRGFDAGAKAKVFVEDDVGGSVAEVEAASKVGDGNDGGFEAFALVDAHEADGVVGGDGGGFGIEAGLEAVVEAAEKAEEALSLEGVELPGEGEELLDVGVALGAAVLGEAPIGVMSLVEDIFEAFGEGALAGESSPVLIVIEEAADGGEGWGRGVLGGGVEPAEEGGPKGVFGGGEPDMGEDFEGKADEGGTEDGEEGEVLEGVIEEAQEISEVGNFDGFEESPAGGGEGDAEAGEGASVEFGAVPGGAEEDDDIAPGCGAVLLEGVIPDGCGVVG